MLHDWEVYGRMPIGFGLIGVILFRLLQIAILPLLRRISALPPKKTFCLCFGMALWRRSCFDNRVYGRRENSHGRFAIDQNQRCQSHDGDEKEVDSMMRLSGNYNWPTCTAWRHYKRGWCRDAGHRQSVDWAQCDSGPSRCSLLSRDWGGRLINCLRRRCIVWEHWILVSTWFVFVESLIEAKNVITINWKW